MMGTTWAYTVIIVCVIVATVTVWLEVSRANKARLVWRIIAVCIALAAMACIILPVSYRAGGNLVNKRFTLLTSGFDSDSLKNGDLIYTLDPSVKKAYPKAVLLNGFGELTNTIKGATLTVNGEGLSPYELEELNGARVNFSPAKQPEGVLSIHWNGWVKAGEPLNISGRFKAKSKTTLLMKGLNTVLDTATLKANSTAGFTLTTIPKSTGRAVYALSAITDGDTVLQGNIPVQVAPVKPLKVLMLSASPDFETRFLKNWLGDQGYSVASRAVISKDKISSDFINLPRFPLERITAANLAGFDLVIGDLSALNSLGASETAALKQQVADKGLGVIIRADSAGKPSWLQQKFATEKAGNAQVSSALLINGKRSTATKLAYQPLYIKPNADVQPLVLDAKAHILAGSTLMGPGRLVFTTPVNTFSWALSGEQKDYAAFWSALIRTGARKGGQAALNIQTSTIPYINEPVKLRIPNSKNSVIKVNNDEVPTLQDRDVSFERTATYYPHQAGWQSIEQTGQTAWWYTFANNEWAGVKAAEKMAATAKYAASHQPGQTVTKQIQQKVRIEVPKIYFYILLVAACTFLWAERKLT